MIPDERPEKPMGRGVLLIATLAALFAGFLIVFGAIMPAEFNRDPLGIGKFTGLARLWAPGSQTINAAKTGPIAREYPRPARSDVIEIPLGNVGGGLGPYALEYKVRMNTGSVLIYEWEALGLDKAENLEYDFHGHTVPVSSDEKEVVSEHKKARGAAGRGSLVAPFDGIQGWYFDNSSPAPIVVRIKLNGFYELVEAGQPGNEFGIAPNLPADRVRTGMIIPQAK